MIAGIALGSTIGGALANVVDRIQFGAVRDFIDLQWKSAYWPTFNLADALVLTGLIGYVVISHLQDKNRRLSAACKSKLPGSSVLLPRNYLSSLIPVPMVVKIARGVTRVIMMLP